MDGECVRSHHIDTGGWSYLEQQNTQTRCHAPWERAGARFAKGCTPWFRYSLKGGLNHRVFVMYLWQTSTLKAHLHSIYSGYTDMSGDSGGLSSYYNLGRYDLSVEEGLWGPRWTCQGVSKLVRV